MTQSLARKHDQEMPQRRRQTDKERIGEFIYQMEKKKPGHLWSYPVIAKELFDLARLPKKDDARVKLVANKGASVRDYLQKTYGADLLVANGSMRALITDDDKVRHRLPKTRARVASAHRQHARSCDVVDPRGLKDSDAKESFEGHKKIAQYGERVIGLLPSRKPERI